MINIVNAEVLLRERGIELIEQSRSDMGAFSSVVTAEVTTRNTCPQSRRHGLRAWTCRGWSNWTNYRLEAYLDGVLMVFTHQDVPGIIGAVGTIFGRHKVNIAQMAVGRGVQGGRSHRRARISTQRRRRWPWTKSCAHPAIHNVVVIKLPPAGEKPAWMAG